MMDHIVTSPYGKEKNFTSPKDREYITTKKNKCQVLSKSSLTLWVNLITIKIIQNNLSIILC